MDNENVVYITGLIFGIVALAFSWAAYHDGYRRGHFDGGYEEIQKQIAELEKARREPPLDSMAYDDNVG